MSLHQRFAVGSFFLAIMCMSMPFVSLSAFGVNLGNLTGFQLMTGIPVMNQNIGGNPLMWIVWSSLGAGCIICLFGFPLGSLSGGIIGMAFLLILKFSMAAEIAKLVGQTGVTGMASSAQVVQVDFEFGYWLVFLLSIASMYFNWASLRLEISALGMNHQEAQS